MLGAEVRFDRLDFRRRAPGLDQIVDGFVIDREKAHGRTVLGRHVADGRAIGHRERRRTFAKVFDEFADDLGFAQHLGHREHQVGGSDAFAQAALEMDADDVGSEEVHRLAEHAGFGFDASDTPRDHADAVDHGGMRICAHERVRIINTVSLMHAASEVFEIDLVHDAYPGGHDLERVERLHAPLHEFVALRIALEFDLHV